MSSIYASALLGLSYFTKKKESSIEPFKRTAKLADEEQTKALVELECAVQELTKAVEDKDKGK